MKKKTKINKKDLERLKPITLESNKKQKKDEKLEEKNQVEEDESFEDEEQQFQQRPQNFNSSVIPFRAPVLEKSQIQENLESEISNTPITQATPTTHKELTYVQNLPKYSGADYTAARYEMDESVDTRRDKEVNISRTREFVPTAMHQENRAINVGAWQRENVFNRPDMTSREDDRDYVLRAKEKKDADKLPFQ